MSTRHPPFRLVSLRGKFDRIVTAFLSQPPIHTQVRQQYAVQRQHPMYLPGVTLFPLNVQGYRLYLNMKYEKRNWHGQYLNSLLYLELATLLIFDFSIMTLGFICWNRISLPLLLHQLLIFIALYSLQLINTMLGYTRQQLIFFQNLPLRECMGILVKQLDLPPHHHHQKAFFQFLSFFFFWIVEVKAQRQRPRHLCSHIELVSIA